MKNEKRKLEQMQKPTSVQLDEKVEDVVNDKMDSTVPNEVRTILASSIKPSAFKSSRFLDKYAKKANNNETQHGGIYGKRGRRWKNRNKNKKSEIVSAENNTSTGNNSADNAAEEKSTENAPITITIPVTQQAATPASTPQNAPIPFRSGNRGTEVIINQDGATLNTPVSLMLIGCCPIEYFRKPSGSYGT